VDTLGSHNDQRNLRYLADMSVKPLSDAHDETRPRRTAAAGGFLGGLNELRLPCLSHKVIVPVVEMILDRAFIHWIPYGLYAVSILPYSGYCTRKRPYREHF
jgi:hypothetical protein